MAKKLNMKDFEKKITLRKLSFDDYDSLIELQKRCFPNMKNWLPEQIKSQISSFPEGQICIVYENKIVATASCLIVDFSFYRDFHDWRKISDNGYITNHDPYGNTLYGIEIMVDPDYRGMKLARRLYDARKRLCREYNLEKSIIGGRIPNYHKYAKKMTAREYAEKVISKELYDPVLTTQISNGYVLKKLIPDYLPGDNESMGYATFLEWSNLDYVEDPKKKLAKTHIARVCAIQYQMRKINGFDDFASYCEYFVDVASDYKSDFILFPEIFTMQLLSFLPGLRPGLSARMISEFTPQYLDLFTGLAVKYNVNIIGGSHLTVEDDNLYNISYIFLRNGQLKKQYKLHITPNEKRWWGVQPGKKVEVIDTDAGRIAVLICYDIEFPELCRIAVSKGAQIIFVPFCTDERNAYLRVRYCAQARSVENQIYVVIAGSTGNLPSVENFDIQYAQSAVFTPADIPYPRDAIAAECSPNIEMLIYEDLDLELLKGSRQAGSVLNLKDRRKDIYALKYIPDNTDV